MYAVIETGGKQYKVSEGEVISIEKLELAKDAPVVFDKVLLVSDAANTTIGQPYINGVSVSGKVLDELKDKKVTIQRFKPKTGYERKKGHRQIYTIVQIDKINK